MLPTIHPPDSKSFQRARVSWKRLILGLLFGLAAVPALAEYTEYDECDARFIAFLGSDAYQFSPRLPDELGKVRLYSVLSYQRAAAGQDYGRAFWRLEIRGPVGRAQRLVRTAEGSVRIDAAGQAVAEVFWDGRDEKGRLVPAGTYQYTFLGRFAPDRLFQDKLVGYGDLAGETGVDEASASTFDVIVDYGMTADAALRLRMSKALGSCQMQQNTPIETSFGYNFYYGSTHSHSNYSDGGHPTSACSSGNAYGSGTFDPAAVYDFARNSAGLDFWVINEHNHLINDSVATNNSPMTEAKVRQRYAAGLAAANAATVNGVFVGLYGMEWGVTTNGDQGHVTLLETPKLFGWETCRNCNGSNAECTPGTNCYFDVFTPKRFGYLTLYKRSVENPSPAGALGILCHPSIGEFDNYAFNSDADQALQGIAVRSGMAFNNATNCADANVASTDYTPRWRDALNKGFHLGPVADHDAHCNNFGVGIPNRTVYLLPNNVSPALTKKALLQAHKARHFFAAEDSNAQLIFATSDGSHIMGDIFNATGSATLRAAVYDPGNETLARLEIWRGQTGGGVPTSPYRTVSNQSSLTLTETLASGTYYYYVHSVQSDGHDLWSAPMWITYGPGGGVSADVSGWRISQLNATYNYTIPVGTVIPANGYLIVARNATKRAFEKFWRGGTPLPTNALYVNSVKTLPVINGSETYDLYNTAGTRIDGRTIAMAPSAGKSAQRKDPCLSPSATASWTVAPASSATPGSGAAAGCAKGMVINEFSDALGTGNFNYEFIELHNDQ